jgi:hypothetical protein
VNFLIYEENLILFLISVSSSPYASEFASCPSSKKLKKVCLERKIEKLPQNRIIYLTFNTFFNDDCLLHRTAVLYSHTEENTNIVLIIIYFREQILNSRDTSRIPILVIGNKSDLLLDFSTERNRLRYP